MAPYGGLVISFFYIKSVIFWTPYLITFPSQCDTRQVGRVISKSWGHWCAMAPSTASGELHHPICLVLQSRKFAFWRADNSAVSRNKSLRGSDIVIWSLFGADVLGIWKSISSSLWLLLLELPDNLSINIRLIDDVSSCEWHLCRKWNIYIFFIYNLKYCDLHTLRRKNTKLQ